MYMCVCVCVCVCARARPPTHTHTHKGSMMDCICDLEGNKEFIKKFGTETSYTNNCLEYQEDIVIKDGYYWHSLCSK
jgi:hypothetical protein